MSASKFAALLTLTGVLCTVVASPVAEAGKKRNSTHRMRAAFLPPPPAYMPSILPESYYRYGVTEAATGAAPQQKIENPLAKYVYNRSGEEIKAINTRKGVSNWAPLRVKKSS